MVFQLERENRRYYIVGAYIPLSNLTTVDHIQATWANCPKGCTPWLLSNFNINLLHPKDERYEEIAEECAFMELTDTSHHFQPTQRQNTRG